MELYLSLLSPVWWASVLVASAVMGGLCAVIRGILTRPRVGSPVVKADPVAHRVRLWVVNLLVVANLALLAGLAAVNLRTPDMHGPVALAFVLLCLFSLTLSTWMFLGTIGGRTP